MPRPYVDPDPGVKRIVEEYVYARDLLDGQERRKSGRARYRPGEERARLARGEVKAFLFMGMRRGGKDDALARERAAEALTRAVEWIREAAKEHAYAMTTFAPIVDELVKALDK